MATSVQQAQERLKKVQNELEDAMRQLEPEQTPSEVQAVEEPEPPKPPGTKRGLETLFRGSYRVQMDLTGLADTKANIMISINGIIMSIIIASVAPKLDANPWLLAPTTLLLVGSMVSMTFAVLAARPRVSHDPITLDDMRHSRGNLLFFGNFAKLSEDDFVQGFEGLMEDQALIYDTMIRNIHGIGKVLNKKYALLQHAYSSFMVALILGVSSFIAVFIWIMLRTPG